MSYQRILTTLLVSMALLACDAKQQESTAQVASVAEPAKTPASAPANETPAPTTLFRNVRIFNGVDPVLQDATDVLVRGNRIVQIGKTDLPAEPGMTMIDGGGRTLMPGLIDNHWHALAARPSVAVAMTSTAGYLNLLAGAEASDTLQRGFTTVRDLGGATFGLKRAIDEGWQAGPRIYPSGAIISVTGGHGDFRSPDELPRALGTAESRQEIMGDTAIADTPDEVRLRVREQLMRGASQVKLTVGGGVSSPHSPLDVVAFTPEEIRAAVVAANNWGTYVTAHAFTPETIKASVEAGVQCIEHGVLMDEPTAQLMANRGTWLSIQPIPEDLLRAFPPDSEEYAKGRYAISGIPRAYALAKKYKLKTAFGTDVLFSAALARRQGELLASVTKFGYTPAEALTMATSTNAQLLALSGKRNPYPGKLGVVEVGALADLLLVDGNPIENIALIADPQRNFLVIMKDGKIYKNTVAAQPVR